MPSSDREKKELKRIADSEKAKKVVLRFGQEPRR